MGGNMGGNGRQHGFSVLLCFFRLTFFFCFPLPRFVYKLSNCFAGIPKHGRQREATGGNTLPPFVYKLNESLAGIPMLPPVASLCLQIKQFFCRYSQGRQCGRQREATRESRVKSQRVNESMSQKSRVKESKVRESMVKSQRVKESIKAR